MIKITRNRAALTLLLLLSVSCSDDSASSPTAADEEESTARTLQSLQQVDDHPLYTLHYYADYDFDRLLQPGDTTAARPLGVDEGAASWACTIFSALNPDADAIVGRSFDWHEYPALLLYTDPPDGFASVSMVSLAYLGYGAGDTPEEAPEALLQAPFCPMDGMNEHGLAMGVMALPYSEFPLDPAKVSLHGLAAIRYVLDYATTVDEALQLLGQINVTRDDPGDVIEEWLDPPGCHYLIADAARNTAILEFIGGEMKVLQSTEPWQVSTNFLISLYTPESAMATCWRYKTACDMLASVQGSMDDGAAMELLSAVAKENTQWSMVYNLTTRDFHVAMGRKYDRVLEFALE